MDAEPSSVDRVRTERSTAEPASTLEGRRELGRQTREHLIGDGGTRLGRIPEIAPEFTNFLYESIFGHIYQFPGLDEKTRQLCTVAILAALGRERQLHGHVQAALGLGIPRETLVALFAHVAAYAGAPAGITGLHVLGELSTEYMTED